MQRQISSNKPGRVAFIRLRNALKMSVAAVVLALGGCIDGGIAPTIAVFDTVSVINTDKTITDHAMSFYRGKDCSTVRAYYGGAYCVENYVNRPIAQQPMYCYKSLGSVTCYEQPDPRASSSQLVGTPIPPPSQLNP